MNRSVKKARAKSGNFWSRLSPQDRRFYGLFVLVCGAGMVVYALFGGENIFILPALLCAVLYCRKSRKRVASK